MRGVEGKGCECYGEGWGERDVRGSMGGGI